MYLSNHHAHLTGKEADKLLNMLLADNVSKHDIREHLHLLRLPEIDKTYVIMCCGEFEGRRWEIDGIVRFDWERHENKRK